MVHGSTQGRRQGWGWGQTEGWGLCQHALGNIRYEEKKGLEGQTAGQADGELHCSASGCTGQGQRKGLGEQTDTRQKDGHRGYAMVHRGAWGEGWGIRQTAGQLGMRVGTAVPMESWPLDPNMGPDPQTDRDGMGWDHEGRDREAPGAGRGLEAWRAQKEQTSEQSPQPCHSPLPPQPDPARWGRNNPTAHEMRALGAAWPSPPRGGFHPILHSKPAVGLCSPLADGGQASWGHGVAWAVHGELQCRAVRVQGRGVLHSLEAAVHCRGAVGSAVGHSADAMGARWGCSLKAAWMRQGAVGT